MAKAAKMLADDTEKSNENDDQLEDNLSHVNNLFGSDDCEVGKSTQKVRFSLEGNTSFVSQIRVDASVEDNASFSKFPSLPLDSMIQSLVTPAKTFALHQELVVGDFDDSNSNFPVELEDQMNIVTENKDKDPTFKCIEGEIDHLSSSPCDSNAYTPLNATNRRDSLQSEIKSKRLFESTSSTKKAMHKRINSVSTSVVVDSNVSTSTKVTLRQLAERCHMETEWDNCKDAGVSDVVLKLTSANAVKLRFSQDEGSPLFFLGQRIVPGCNHVGTVDDIYKWLVDEGFDESLFTKKWIQNHYRWIVWKLGSSKFL